MEVSTMPASGSLGAEILAPESNVTIIAPAPGIRGNLPATGIPGKSEVSWEPKDYIKPSLIRYAQYEYQTGTTFFLSKTEQIVVDAYLKTHNEAEAVRAVQAIYVAHGSPRRFGIKAIHRWLQKPHIARYIADKYLDEGKVNWFDQKKWEAYGVDVMNGKFVVTQVQVAIWKEFGKAKGWFMPEGPSIQHNTMINFTQSSGQA